MERFFVLSSRNEVISPFILPFFFLRISKKTDNISLELKVINQGDIVTKTVRNRANF